MFKQTPNKHLNGRGCPICGGNLKLTNEEFISKANLIHNNLYNYNEVSYENSFTNVKIICKNHGIFYQIPHNHLQGNGCKLCGNPSKGELVIKNTFDNIKIVYITQYGFNDLRYKKPLKFDFAIFDNNGILICLVEYNGIQHYQYIDFFHRNQENFEIYKLKDKIKMEYCNKKNIKLIIIKYDQLKKINEILDAEFKTKYESKI